MHNLNNFVTEETIMLSQNINRSIDYHLSEDTLTLSLEERENSFPVSRENQNEDGIEELDKSIESRTKEINAKQIDCLINNNHNQNLFEETSPIIKTPNPTSTKLLSKMSDAYLSSVKSENFKTNSNFNNIRQGQLSAPNTPESMRRQHFLAKHRTNMAAENNSNCLMMSSVPPLSVQVTTNKKDKMEFNQMMMRMNCNEIKSESNRPLSYHGKTSTSSSSSLISSPIINKRHVGSPIINPRNKNKELTSINRRSMPPGQYTENRMKDKFDISDLDTNLPRIDIEAIESHLKLAREEERKRRSDRDEIRRRLALESEDLINDKQSGRKPSLHSRLQSSMNLQICFMNETASDSESPGSDNDVNGSQQPASLPYMKPIKPIVGSSSGGAGILNNGKGIFGGGQLTEDFYAKLQADAKHALSQAKDMARIHMSSEKGSRLNSPITEMVRNSLLKVGVTLPPERRRVSRQLLTEMNVAQLQVIVNDLHSHIEVLNGNLVSMLLDRDDLHMEQDSMLVDIEDLTRYLAAKESSPHQSLPFISSNNKTLVGKK